MKQTKQSQHENQLETKLLAAKEVVLSDADKDRMHSFLSSYVDMHPVLSAKERIERAKRNRHSTFKAFVRLMPAFMLTIFVLGGGAVLADRSLPGDTLYGVKTAGENLYHKALPTAEAKARFGIDRVQRRIEEAYKLSEIEGVKPGNYEALVNNLDQNTKELEATVEVLEESEKPLLAFEVKEEYQSRLRVHRNILTKLSEENTNIRELLGFVSNRLSAPGELPPEPEVVIVSVTTHAEGADTASLPEEDVSREDVDNLPLEDEETPLDEDGDALAVGAELGEEGADAGEASPEGEEAPALMMMRASEPVSDGGVSPAVIRGELGTDALISYVESRISSTEKLIESTKNLDGRVAKELKSMLNEARELLKKGSSLERGEVNDAAVRTSLTRSASLIEDARTILRIAGHARSEFFLELILSGREDEKGSAPRDDGRGEERSSGIEGQGSSITDAIRGVFEELDK